MKKKIVFKNREYFGAGVILYHGRKILMQKVESRNFWEDFGGKTDRGDKNIIETSFRECEEESNNILNKEYLMAQIEKNPSRCYYLLQNNKYFIYMIYVNRKEKDRLKSEIFGKCEKHDGIERVVEWISRNEKLHPRITTMLNRY